MRRNRRGPEVNITMGPLIPEGAMQAMEQFLACMDILTYKYEEGLPKEVNKLTNSLGEITIDGEVLQIQISLAKKPAHISDTGVVMD